ncbi:ATP-binding protein [Candidatus Poribacteria bacterium]|nr:ATP-binding protein [Candidatus Poribacteria bacterium]
MFKFQNFKGFEAAKLNLEKPLTVLIGPNGSGKSNTIEAVELLSFLVRGQPLHEVTDLGRGGSLEVRGGLSACARVKGNPFEISFDAKLPFEGAQREISYSIKVVAAEEMRIVSEALRVRDRDIPIFETTSSASGGASADNEVRYDNFARGRNKPTAPVAADRSVLSQYARFATDNRKLSPCLELIGTLAKVLEAAFVFDPIPKLMRGYERLSETVLARNGFNVSPVLFNLSRRPMVFMNKERVAEARAIAAEKNKSLARIRDRICQLPDEPFQDFDFIRTRSGDVMLGFKTPEPHRLVDARLLSDGTLRTLAILTALETVAVGSRIVIEEFDNGVHPSRVRILTEALADCCKRRQLRALVTTHNPATLNELLPEQIEGVVFSVWAQNTQSFNLVELSELPRHVEFMERGRLGDLVTRRIVEQYLAPGFTDSQTDKALAWLETLR